MARFKIFLIGSSHAPLVELAADNLRGVEDIARYNRYLEAEILDCLEDDGPLRVLIPVSRIQMIAEARS